MKAYLRWLLVATATTGIVLLSAGIISLQSNESKMALKIAALPPAVFTTLQDMPFNLADLKKSNALLVVYFSPDCDHCQHSAEALYRYRNELGQSTIVMISGEAAAAVKAFASRYRLDQMENVVLLLDRDGQAQQVLGLYKVPSYLLYDKRQRLIKKIVGEVTMDFIVKTFKQG